MPHRASARNNDLMATNSRLAGEVAERRSVEQALRREKQLSDDIINSLPGIFYVLDENSRFLRWNQHFLELTGYGPEEFGRMHLLDFIEPDDRERFAEAIAHGLRDRGMFIEAVMVTREGRQIPYYFTGKRTVLDGRPYLVGLGVDISERIVREKELKTQALTDALTGVSNRRHFMELAEGELARTRRYGGTLSLLMLDLDHFKSVNDTYGHQVGDRVLQALGDTCRKIFRNIDIVGRIGGEEFAILLPATDIAKAHEVAERLRKSLEAAVVPTEDGGRLNFTASIGIAGFSGRETHIGALLGQADKALYQAKHDGRNRVVTTDERHQAAA